MRALPHLLAVLLAVPSLAAADETRASRPAPPADSHTAPSPPAPAPSAAAAPTLPPPPTTPPPDPRATRPLPPDTVDPGRAPRPLPPGATGPGPNPVPPPPGQVPPPPPGYYDPPYGYGWDAGWGMGWGAAWGYGYLPAYGEPVVVAPGAPPPWPPPPPTSAVLRITFGAGHMGGMHDSNNAGEIWGSSFLVDTHRLGFDMAFDAFTPTSVGGTSTSTWSGADPYGLSTFHVTWSVLASRSYRLRVLVGGSWLSIPYSTSSTAADSFGPDLGLSGQVGIAGPFGIEAHARWTPVPIMVFDGGAAAALHFGPFGLSMGYRWVNVAADTRTGPAVSFQGPEMALGVIF